MLALVFSDGAYIFFTILFIIATILITIFLFMRFRKEHKTYKEEMTIMMDGLLTKSEINTAISSFLTKAARDTVFALFYIDLDKYSEILNAFGQKESERILEKIAHKIVGILPKKTQLARYQMDEFIVFLKEEYTRLEYLEIAKAILTVINEPITIYHNTTIQVTGSIGLSIFPKHGSTLKQLLNSLKIAVYIAKREGGNRTIIYSDEMSEKESENVEYYYQIKEAIKKKEFLLYYQPIINYQEKNIVGAEALLRWHHPEHGVLSPFQFINILEQSGDINWVGLWGLESVILSFLELKLEFPHLDLNLSLNLSPKQLMNETLAVEFQKILKKHKMHAKNITLEIAEFVMFEHYTVIKQNIKQLKELGFTLAIDGIGLDYQTLTKLEYLPVDIIKLDRNFIEREGDSFMKEKFTDLLVDFAKNNKRTIIAEGIENKEILETVKAHGIDLVQGFYFSKPISIEEFKAYIRNERWKKEE